MLNAHFFVIGAEWESENSQEVRCEGEICLPWPYQDMAGSETGKGEYSTYFQLEELRVLYVNKAIY